MKQKTGTILSKDATILSGNVISLSFMVKKRENNSGNDAHSVKNHYF
ncbi:hypothetical protein M3090_09475 [Bacteroides sp. ET71]|nr:hypothetical protein [Bacteroides sp. ET71]MCL1616621.1 hypothetical protein [Bacteroides sp. ET71]